MAWTWTELLDDIKVRGMIPTSQSTYTAARLLSIANAALRSKLLPLILSARENYYSYDIDTAVNATGVYDIHTRAIGGKIDNVALIDGTGRLDLPLLSEEELTDYGTSPTPDPGFYVKRSQIVVVPASAGGYPYLRQTIFLRPPTIVAQSSAAQITAINTVTKVVTFTDVPSAWTTANLFDMVQAIPHFDTLGIDLVATAVVTGALGTVTFSAAISSRLAVGDWVSLAGETPVIQVPVELNPLLAQEAANECLKNGADPEAYKIGLEEVKILRQAAIPLLTPRVERAGKKLVNRTGILRRGR